MVGLGADYGSEDQPAFRAARVAAGQGGAISHAQLCAIGLGRGAIKYWLRSGRLHPRYKGVYALGHPVLGPRGILWAALLACGDGAVVSHRDAAALWGIRQNNRRRVDVTVPGRTRTRRHGIEVHLVRHLDPRDVTEIDGLPVTTLARTLLDIAEVVPQNQLRRAINEADYLKLFDLTAVEDQLSRSNGRRGQKPLSAALIAAFPEERTRSDLEEAFLAFCAQRQIPRPKVNLGKNGKELDMVWPEHNLIVELDGYQGHRTRRAFEHDRRRDARHLLEGLRTVRVTNHWLTREPEDLEATLKQLLTRRAGEDERG